MGSTSSLCSLFHQAVVEHKTEAGTSVAAAHDAAATALSCANVNASASKRSMASGVVYTAASGV